MSVCVRAGPNMQPFIITLDSNRNFSEDFKILWGKLYEISTSVLPSLPVCTVVAVMALPSLNCEHSTL